MQRVLAAGMLVLVLLLSACGQGRGLPQEGSPVPQASGPAAASFEGTVFRYGDHDYDMSSRIQGVNSILSAVPVGEKIVVECHSGPKNGIFCIFDTKNETFDKDVIGNHLIWYNDDITTAVYSFWSEVFAYDGNVLKTYDLEKDGCIRDLAFSDGHTRLNVTILRGDGAEETDTIALPGE